MIFDSIDNIKQYLGLSPSMDRAIDFLVNNNVSDLEEQRIDIAGDDVYVMIQHYSTEGLAGRSFETHDDYIDIQYVASGVETIIYGNRRDLAVEKAYDPKADCTLYQLDGVERTISLDMKAGDFAVFFPADGHVPKIWTTDVPSKVVKAVFKVRVS